MRFFSQVIAILLIFSLGWQTSAFSIAAPAFQTARVAPTPLEERIQKLSLIQKTEVSRILSERKPEGYWFYPSTMGIAYTGLYWLVSQWLGQELPQFDTQRFVAIVLKDQLADGSWYYIADKSVESDGPLGATIQLYWALKAMGQSIDSPPMAKAREYILKSGGLASANNITKIFLASFGNLDWDQFPVPPDLKVIPVKNVLDLVLPYLGTWMKPFLRPVVYLAKLRVAKVLGGDFQIQELIKNPADIPDIANQNSSIELPELAQTIYNLHRPRGGSWGGTTSATLLSMMALDNAKNYMPKQAKNFEAAIKDADRFLKLLNIDAEVSAYRGAVFDGRYWDTVLLGTTLLESGVPAAELKISAAYVDRFINRKTGGMSFGLDFEQDPDTDDTSEMIIFFRRGSFFPKAVAGGFQWLKKMQNEADWFDGTPGSGGWGSYSKDNNGPYLLQSITQNYKDSTWIFDPATPDVTGHILEGFGALGLVNSGPTALTMVQTAVDYMRKAQREDGTWFGRWGVNSIYGTGAAIVGLRAVGIPTTDPMIVRGMNWIAACQKPDGSFGESFLSYSDPRLSCLSVPSTPTQTAWALLAMLSALAPEDPRILRAIDYLASSYDTNVGWIDEMINGTGHPIVVPIFYPSYAKVFPLQAISRWLSKSKNIVAQ